MYNIIHTGYNSLCFTSFNLYSIQYCIKSINTTPASPNMKSLTERFIGTLRREALDHFLLFSEKQIRNIITNYVGYYSTNRMHQGIEKIPESEIQECSRVI